MTGETGMSFSCRRNEETDGADCTSSGRVFQKMEAARGNERRPAVVIVSLWSTHVTKGDKNADNPQDGLSSVVNTCLREFSLVQFSSVQYTFV